MTSYRQLFVRQLVDDCGDKLVVDRAQFEEGGQAGAGVLSQLDEKWCRYLIDFIERSAP